jgi:hypothetical protein
MVPCLLLAEATETTFLADMTRDGLTDLVRVRSGEVRNRPNPTATGPIQQGHGVSQPKCQQLERPTSDRRLANKR